MKIQTIRKKSRKELERNLDSLRKEVATLQRDTYVKQESNVKKVRNIRRDIARVMTILNENTEATKADSTKTEKEN